MKKFDLYSIREKLCKEIEDYLYQNDITHTSDIEIDIDIEGFLFVFNYSCYIYDHEEGLDEIPYLVIDNVEVFIGLKKAFDNYGDKMECYGINETLGYLHTYLEQNAYSF